MTRRTRPPRLLNALSPLLIKIIYTVGTLCAVYHLTNGIWTFGITWGLWTSDRGQRRAGYFCAAFGVLVALFGMGSLYGMSVLNIGKATIVEDNMQVIREAERGEVQWSSNAAGGEYLGKASSVQLTNWNDQNTADDAD